MGPVKNKARLASSVALAMFLVSLAEACSVCAVGKDEARVAYYATTAILSFLPLMMIGGVVYFLFRNAKNRRERQD